MQIGNTNFISLDELTQNAELEQKVETYCNNFENYMLNNGCANCPFKDILKKNKECCHYNAYKKLNLNKKTIRNLKNKNQTITAFGFGCSKGKIQTKINKK